jgi:hypothetical protein
MTTMPLPDLPRYIKIRSAKDEQGKRHDDWLVRQFNPFMIDENGDKYPTPLVFFDRYYRSANPEGKVKSRLHEIRAIWVTFDQAQTLK